MSFASQEPRAKSPSGNARAFTLIEVLAAVAVLIIGFAGVIALLYGSFVQGHVASDRNAAIVLIPEAIRQIEQEHLIVASIDAANEGMFIETLDWSPHSDKGVYSAVEVGLSGDEPPNPPFEKPPPPPMVPLWETGNLTTWPHTQDFPRRIGQLYYRVRYRLEKHHLWEPHNLNGTPTAGTPDGAYEGVYILTLACYRDLAPTGVVPELRQISDPVIVYLRRK